MSILAVGGFGKSIEIIELLVDASTTAKLVHKSSKPCAPNPAFLTTHQNSVYVVHENFDSGEVSYHKWVGNELKHIVSHNSCGNGACHVDINTDTSSLFISNYYSGHFVVLKLKDGLPSGSLFIESYEGGSLVNKERQEASHPHGCFLYKNFIYICDLGADKIWHYAQKEGIHGAITPCDPSFTETPPGSGPRHMAFHGNIAFALMELSNEVLVYRIDDESGRLELLSSLNYLEGDHAGENYGAEIMVHPHGGFLYLSNRVNGCIVVYDIKHAVDGNCKRVQCIPSGGTWPRHFTIHPSGGYLICADQFKDELTLFSIGSTTGLLTRLQSITCANKPSCIGFIS